MRRSPADIQIDDVGAASIAITPSINQPWLRRDQRRPATTQTSLRHWPVLSWLGNPATFVIGTPMLSLLALVTSLYIPRLVTPAEFGTYALLMNLCRYAGYSDLGLSQLADKRFAHEQGSVADAQRLLDVRFRLGFVLLLITVPTVAVGAMIFGASPLNASIAVTAGIFAMMCGGPTSLFRAQGRVWEFTALGFMFGLGFILPRLLGFAVGGVTGCFVLLLLWYFGVAAFFLSKMKIDLLTTATLETLKASLPLFVFAGAWILYLSADRWIASTHSSAHDFGLFALGANLSVAGITTFGQIADIRYPHWLRRLASAKPFAQSGALEAEGLAIVGLVCVSVLVLAPLTPAAITFLFPRYAGAAPSAIGLASACVPLSVVAWFLPIVIARSKRPMHDAAIVFLPAILIMCCGMAIGAHIDGIRGQAWASAFSSLVLLAGLAFVMHRCTILRIASGLRMVAAAVLALASIHGMAAAQGADNAASIPSRATLHLPPDGWKQTFSDSFQTLSVWNGTSGTWQTSYASGIRTNPTNRELEFYASAKAAPKSLRPFSVDSQGLTITARRVPDSELPSTGRFPFVSGLLNSSHSFLFTYGYVEMRALVPKGKGLWPAFWLLPSAGNDPPELDIMEFIGDEDQRYYATLHSGVSGVSMHVIGTPDLSEGLHDYGVLWTAKDITWYFDRKPVATVPTPVDMHQTMYLVLNLAVGGNWPGTPDAKTIFPARMLVKSVKVYQEPSKIRETSR